MRPALPLLLTMACTTATPDKEDTDPDTDAGTDTADTPSVDTDEHCSHPPLDLTWAEDTTGYEARAFDYTVPFTGAARNISWNLWYPTHDTTGEPARYINTFLDEHALVDAAFADPAPGCKLPLVVYSHGSQSWGGSASTVVRHLVSQGWVAAAPDHTDNVFLANVEPHPLSFSLVRVEDVRRTIDAIDALPDEHPLAGRVDTDHVLVVGHSYGGQTAWLVAGPSYDLTTIADACGDVGCTQDELDAFQQAEADPRVVATMPLDGSVSTSMVAAAGWADVTMPIFAQSQDNTSSAEMYARAQAAADVRWLTVRGSCHESFTGNPIPCESLDKAHGLGIVGTYLYAFAAKHVLGDAREVVDAVLNGSTEVSPLVGYHGPEQD